MKYLLTAQQVATLLPGNAEGSFIRARFSLPEAEKDLSQLVEIGFADDAGSFSAVGVSLIACLQQPEKYLHVNASAEQDFSEFLLCGRQGLYCMIAPNITGEVYAMEYPIPEPQLNEYLLRALRFTGAPEEVEPFEGTFNELQLYLITLIYHRIYIGDKYIRFRELFRTDSFKLLSYCKNLLVTTEKWSELRSYAQNPDNWLIALRDLQQKELVKLKGLKRNPRIVPLPALALFDAQGVICRAEIEQNNGDTVWMLTEKGLLSATAVEGGTKIRLCALSAFMPVCEKAPAEEELPLEEAAAVEEPEIPAYEEDGEAPHITVVRLEDLSSEEEE